ncbi:MAG: DEAD/DEAH box helicase family protein [ANME-2 cluster archaeon]|nr:DEAD/DEAH box helicase family protein [ANME-2 cluster archaeon]
MGLEKLNLKGLYDSDADDLLLDFYIPVLKESIDYKRIAGYFSSNSLAIAAKGISKFIQNGGKMYLIANVILSSDDQEVIKKTISEKEIEILDEIETMEDAVKKGHLRLLAWMLKNGNIEIRIAKVQNGIEHKKKGILEDLEGNIISFSGSDNETVSGWLFNHEDFHVFCSWIDGDKERHLNPDIVSFEKLWNDETNAVRIFNVSDAFKFGLIKSAPKDEEEFRTLSNEMAEEAMKNSRLKKMQPKSVTEKPLRDNLFKFLRPYQNDAINRWESNGHMGILEMATGTGKTFTAIAAIERYLNEKKKGVVVIVAPKQLLVSQWSNELKKLGFSNVIEVMKNSSVWKKDLKGAILKVDLGHEKEVIAVATYASFCTDNFISTIRSTNTKPLLICDEMHNSWAPKYRQGLINSYESRLGLSATPERYMDEKGTEDMQKYFGNIVYTFGISEAIPEYLVPYEYHAEIVELTADEKYEYEELTSEISIRIATNNGEVDDVTFLKILKRSKIVINSDSKWPAFENILDSLPNLKRTLIYCSDKQIGRVLEILHSRKIYAHKITYKESLKQREEIIESFISDDYKAIVAIKVLDEGIDVPGIERAIILSSSGNPIEYVQRRGRILRRSEGKEFATVYDILIFPWKIIPQEISKSELSLLRKEMKRIDEFVNSSKNPLEVMNKIVKYKTLLNLR